MILIVSTFDLQLNKAFPTLYCLIFAAPCREVASIPAFQMGKLSLRRLRDSLRTTQLRAGPGLAWVCLVPKETGGKEPTALEHPGRYRTYPSCSSLPRDTEKRPPGHCLGPRPPPPSEGHTGNQVGEGQGGSGPRSYSSTTHRGGGGGSPLGPFTNRIAVWCPSRTASAEEKSPSSPTFHRDQDVPRPGIGVDEVGIVITRVDQCKSPLLIVNKVRSSPDPTSI